MLQCLNTNAPCFIVKVGATRREEFFEARRLSEGRWLESDLRESVHFTAIEQTW